MQEEAIKSIVEKLGLSTKENNFSLKKEWLALQINNLLNTDFQKLVSILYRMDVSEHKLKLLLKDNPDTDAGLLIADLMIERQVEKIKSRQQFRQRDNNIDESEKW
jgi:hypothetical protein